MRSSADRDDPGFVNFRPGQYEIFLDGRRIDRCITADEERGVVVVFAAGEFNGHALTRDGELERLEFRGRVEIRKKKP